MRRLIYTSQSLVGSDPRALDAIVEHSMISNQAAGVTGLLWCDGDHFAQALEGSHAALADTIERIQSDPRHEGIEIVSDRRVGSRVFGGWAMACPNAEPAAAIGTAFLIGFACSERSSAAKRLYDIVVASEG